MALPLPKSLLEFPREHLEHPVMERHLPAEGLQYVDIDMQYMGQLLILFDAEDTVYLRAAGNERLVPDEIIRHEDRLLISSHNISSLIRQIFRPKLVMELHLPKHCDININFIAGSVSLLGGTGSLSVQGVFGEVVGLSYSSNAMVRLSFGSVEIIELQGMADVRIGIGSTEIGLDEMNGRERMRLRCGVGSIELTVAPQDAPEEDHGGFFKNKAIETPKGARIEASVGVGSIETMYSYH